VTGTRGKHFQRPQRHQNDEYIMFHEPHDAAHRHEELAGHCPERGAEKKKCGWLNESQHRYR